jgi:hypothetical protein
MSPAHPEWIGLCEQQFELKSALKYRLDKLTPTLKDGLYFNASLLQNFEEPFRRGFPYRADYQPLEDAWTDDEVKLATKRLEQAVEKTTIRSLATFDTPTRQLSALLSQPVIAHLRGLAFHLETFSPAWERDFTAFYRTFGNNPNLAGLQQLDIAGRMPDAAIPALATATELKSIRELSFQEIAGTPQTIAALTQSRLFSQLREFTCVFRDLAVATSVLVGLGDLPELHTLGLAATNATTLSGLAQGEFPALASLGYQGNCGALSIQSLARARLPSLAVLKLPSSGITNQALATLLNASWFSQIRMLELSANSISAKGLQLLAEHPVAQSLRVLNIGENPIGFTGLSILAREGAFPELTTLSLQSSNSHKVTAGELELFLSVLRMPNLRYLNLQGWQLKNAGAKALAKNSSLANLRRLILTDCGLGDASAEAIFQAPHLQNLIELRLDYNSIRAGANSLADSDVMPNLRECWLSNNRISQPIADRLTRENLFLHT